MTMRRFILEMGAGNDLHGGDYTKAAIRAVEDALHHSSLTFARSLGKDASAMKVDITIGVQAPDRVDAERVAKAAPRGTVSVKVVHGGLDVADESGADPAIIASAAIEVWMDVG
jgi:uncharacterized protein (TIGR02058 family)